MLTIIAERRLKTALQSRFPATKRLEGKEGDLVLVFRLGSESWEGPFPVHSYDVRKTVTVDIMDARGVRTLSPFSVTSVKPFTADTSEDSFLPPADMFPETMEDVDLSGFGPETNSSFPLITRDPHDSRFDDAKKHEVLGLLHRGTYEITDITHPPVNSVVLNSRFVLSIK